MTLLPRHVRGSIVRISAREANRLGVPDGRRWLVINSKAIRHAHMTILCQITSETDEQGQRKRQSPTDLLIPTGAGDLSKWSYVCCSVVYTANRNTIEKVIGELPPAFMSKVDECLLEVLALQNAARQLVARESKTSRK